MSTALRLPAALGACARRTRRGQPAVAVDVIGVLFLTGPIFMMQVYDRVLTSGSVPTLIGLA